MKSDSGECLRRGTQHPGSSQQLRTAGPSAAPLRKSKRFVSKTLSFEDRDPSHGTGLGIYEQTSILVFINHVRAEEGIKKSCMNNRNSNHLLKSLCAQIPAKSN